MASVLVNNLPDEMHQQLKLRAQRHHRSLNKELIALIETAIAGDAGERDFRQTRESSVQRRLAETLERRTARVLALRGKYRDSVSSSEVFAARKAEEIALER